MQVSEDVAGSWLATQLCRTVRIIWAIANWAKWEKASRAKAIASLGVQLRTGGCNLRARVVGADTLTAAHAPSISLSLSSNFSLAIGGELTC